MTLRPITLRAANEFVTRVHRHHGRVQGAKFAVALWDDVQLVGVGIAGRPVARMLDDGETIEVTRIATDGAQNACSMLYGALCRAAFAIGYRRVITYILATETGGSALAAGFLKAAETKAEEWDRPSRRRRRTLALPKIRLELRRARG